MSKPRYRWWQYVKNMIRYYPSLCKTIAETQSISLTANYSGMPGGTGVNRTTENVATRELPKTEQKEYDAVRRAVEETLCKVDGESRVKLIKWVFWDNKYTLYGASLEIPISYGTAKNWHNDFIKTVARYYGLIDG